jgi:exosortase
MVPLPFQLDMALAQPLRRIATLASTYLLQTLGFPAISEGNIILIDELRLGVIDACSGLGMLMTFFALATAMALVVQAPLLDRLIIVASAVPIAILANIVRITLTAVAYEAFGEYPLFHDVSGWLMMPLAVAVMWLELRLVGRLLVPVEERRPLPLFPGIETCSRNGASSDTSPVAAPALTAAARERSPLT